MEEIPTLVWVCLAAVVGLLIYAIIRYPKQQARSTHMRRQIEEAITRVEVKRIASAETLPANHYEKVGARMTPLRKPLPVSQTTDEPVATNASAAATNDDNGLVTALVVTQILSQPTASPVQGEVGGTGQGNSCAPAPDNDTMQQSGGACQVDAPSYTAPDMGTTNF